MQAGNQQRKQNLKAAKAANLQNWKTQPHEKTYSDNMWPIQINLTNTPSEKTGHKEDNFNNCKYEEVR